MSELREMLVVRHEKIEKQDYRHQAVAIVHFCIMGGYSIMWRLCVIRPNPKWKS